MIKHNWPERLDVEGESEGNDASTHARGIDGETTHKYQEEEEFNHKGIWNPGDPNNSALVKIRGFFWLLKLAFGILRQPTIF